MNQQNIKNMLTKKTASTLRTQAEEPLKTQKTLKKQKGNHDYSTTEAKIDIRLSVSSLTYQRQKTEALGTNTNKRKASVFEDQNELDQSLTDNKGLVSESNGNISSENFYSWNRFFFES